MTQNVFIIHDPVSQDIIASPSGAEIFTNDQDILWKVLAPDYVWDVEDFNPPITFHEDWFNAGGGQPTEDTGGNWIVRGPGPVSGPAAKFSYTFHVKEVSTGVKINRDPDIWNQPQP